VYPARLSPAEILALQDGARWPAAGGETPALVKECIDPSTDFEFFDTSVVDTSGHTCQWHQSQEKAFPYICNLPWLRRMCPVTCWGRRKCHQGQLSPDFKTEMSALKKYRTHRVFDRIMLIRPQNKSVVCPRDDIVIEEAVSNCRANKAALGDEYGKGFNYSYLYDRTFDMVREGLTDLREW